MSFEPRWVFVLGLLDCCCCSTSPLRSAAAPVGLRSGCYVVDSEKLLYMLSCPFLFLYVSVKPRRRPGATTTGPQAPPHDPRLLEPRVRSSSPSHLALPCAVGRGLSRSLVPIICPLCRFQAFGDGGDLWKARRGRSSRRLRRDKGGRAARAARRAPSEQHAVYAATGCVLACFDAPIYLRMDIIAISGV